MRVLLVKDCPDTARLWRRHLLRQGHQVHLACSQAKSIQLLRDFSVDIIVIDLVLDSGSAFAVADFSSYRQPEAKVIFVTNSSFFSDGSIFQHIPNACALMPSEMGPEDMGALVEHYGTH